MSAPKRLTLFCVLSLLSLLLEPLQAYGVSPFSGLEVANSQNPPGAKVFATKENSPALQSDLRINDVITSIEGQTVNTLEDFVRISKALKDKESVSLSVNRWGVVVEITLGKKSVVEQAKPETRVRAEPPPKQVEVKTLQKGFENPVVPNATGLTYNHGQYPSEGSNTHPGIDIVSDCGSPIHSFADGEVTDLIKDEKDPRFKFLGYMVIVKHLEPINGKDTYSLYLHMKEPPAVSKGQNVKAGGVIGKVGDTGKAEGCHVHFELRHFPDRFLNDKGWNYPLNIYGKGDQRNEKRFLENWEDPEVYFGKYPGGIVGQEKRPQPEAPGVAEGERIEDYFPLQEGARWQYNVEVVSPKKTLFGTQYSKSTSVVTVECKEGMNFQGQEAVMFLEDRGDYQIKRYYRKEGDALLELGYEFVSAKEQIWHALEPPVPILRQPVKPPMSWEIPTSMVGPKGTETSFKYRINVGGGEGITVPAGRFEAIKVVSLTFGEDTGWYAKGVGLVKKIETFEAKEQGGRQTTKYELVSYSATPQLVAKVQEGAETKTTVSGGIYETESQGLQKEPLAITNKEPVDIKNLKIEKAFGGGLEVTGEVKNLGKSPLTHLKIIIYVLDESGNAVYDEEIQLIGEVITYDDFLSSYYSGKSIPSSFETRKYSLKPGFTKQFSCQINSPAGSQRIRAEVTEVGFEEIWRYEERQAYFEKVEIKNLKDNRVWGGYTVSGQIKNLGEESLEKIQITIYSVSENGDRIVLETLSPKNVGKHNLLKPGYIADFNTFVYTAKPIVYVKITDIEFGG